MPLLDGSGEKRQRLHAAQCLLYVCPSPVMHGAGTPQRYVYTDRPIRVRISPARHHDASPELPPTGDHSNACPRGGCTTEKDEEDERAVSKLNWHEIAVHSTTTEAAVLMKEPMPVAS